MAGGGRWWSLAAALVLAVVVAACGGSEDPTPTPGPTPTATPTATPTPTPTPVNPQALLERSGQVLAEVDSFHFRLEHRKGTTSLLPGLTIEEADGDVVRPDRLRVDFRGAFGNVAVKAGLITIGQTSYMSNPITGRWEQTEAEVSPLAFFNPSVGIPAIMSQVTAEGLVEDRRQGRKVYVVTGRMPASALASLLGATLDDAEVRVTLTIDARDLFLLEAVLEGRASPLDPEEVVRVISLSRFNDALEIAPPTP